MSRIRADKILDRAGTGSVELTQGATLPSGKTISGSGTLALNTSGTAAGLSGTPSITVADITGIGANLTGVVTATSGAFSGNVSVGGVLTYEDVTNVDSLGIVTARNGLRVTAGGINVTAGISTLAAVTSTTITATTGANLNGYKVEEGSTASTSLNGEFDFEFENGHIQRYSGATGGNYFPDFRVSSSASLSSIMDVGDVVTATLIVASSSHYCTTGVKVDNSTSNIDLDWVGGSAPSGANGSGFDIYTFTIMKTASTPAYHIIGNAIGVA